MQDSNLPVVVQTPWASGEGSSYVRNVPVPTQSGNAASFTTGFPPITFTPVGSGGAGPDGRDMNGILQYITTWLQWQQAGFFPAYNATFSGYIGGYPNGAILLRASGVGFWRSTVDNNTSDPDTGGANWVLHGTSSVFGRTGDVVAQTGDYAVDQITGAVADTDFTGLNQSLAASGYQKLPGGLVLQWGNVSTSNGTFSFPTPFPTACLIFAPTNANVQGTDVDNAFGYAINASTFFCATKQSNGGGITAYPVAWLAIGY